MDDCTRVIRGGLSKKVIKGQLDKKVIKGQLDKYAQGIDGASAYEVAVKNGFAGTEQEWLESLVGESGAQGIDGKDGKDGIDGYTPVKGIDYFDGEQGKSAYQEWLDLGNEGAIEDFLDSLKGDEYIHPETHGADMIVETEDKQFISSDDKLKLYGFVHEQMVSSKTWNVEHPLDKYPSVSVVDTGGSIVFGSVRYISKSQLEVHFTHEFSGKVYLN